MSTLRLAVRRWCLRGLVALLVVVLTLLSLPDGSTSHSLQTWTGSGGDPRNIVQLSGTLGHGLQDEAWGHDTSVHIRGRSPGSPAGFRPNSGRVTVTEADKEQYKASSARGTKLFQLMDQPHGQASHWEDHADLQRNEWRRGKAERMQISHHWESAIKALDISTNLRYWHREVWEHSGPAKPQKKPATDGKYDLGYSPRGGIMVAFDTLSPQQDTIDLHHFSDIAWLAWKEECHAARADPSKLRYILRRAVNMLRMSRSTTPSPPGEAKS